MRTIDLCFLLLSLLLIPWQIAANIPPTISQSIHTDKACHVCKEEQSIRSADPATIPPTPTTAIATPSPTYDCDDCVLHADRIRSLATQVAREEAISESQDAVIHILFFWMQSCPHCHDVMESVLPPLQEQHGGLLEILLIEIVTVEDVDELYQIAAEFGIAKENTGVPFLIIGDEVLIGSDVIQTRLPPLLQTYLAEGGVDFPQVPGLDVFLERLTTQRFMLTGEIGTFTTAVDLPLTLKVDGAGLAVSTLIGMVLALFYAGFIVIRICRGVKIKPDPPWLAKATPILALVGVFIAGYLAYVETQSIPAFCGPVGDCNTVQSSPYAWLLGVMPVGLLGVLGYLGVFAAWIWGRFREDKVARLTPAVIIGMTLFGVLFSIYLTYLEPFVIRAVCLWCLSSSVIITLLFLINLRPMLQAFEILKD